MKRGRDDDDEFVQALKDQFYRHVFNIPRPPNLKTYTMCYDLSSYSSSGGKDVYQLVKDVFVECYHQFLNAPIIQLASQCPLILELWSFLRKRMGRDVATLIIDLAYRPTRQRLQDIIETLMVNDCGSLKRVCCVALYPDQYPWNHNLLKGL